MTNGFKIQILQDIVRNNSFTLSDKSFTLLAKLIQRYYSKSGEKTLDVVIDHNAIMFHIDIMDKRTFKTCLNELYKCELIEYDIKTLPRKGDISITLSEKIIPELNRGSIFVQLESELLHRYIIQKIGHTGFRLLYYLKSYINYTKSGKDHCYASVLRITNDLKISKNTFIKYIETLEKIKFVKVKRFDVQVDMYYDDAGNEIHSFERFNNHYYIRHEKFKEYIGKQKERLEK